MDTTEGITWTSKKAWGAVGLTHRATVTVGGIGYHFVIDQPSKGDWVARGWKDGDFFFYRDRATARTLSAMKDEVSLAVAGLRLSAGGAGGAGYGEPDLAEAKSEARDSEPECWCEYVDIGVGMQRVTQEPGCPEHSPEPDGSPEGRTDPDADTLDDPEPELLSHEFLHCGEVWGIYETFASLAQVAAATSTHMRHLAGLLTPPCGCPTPTHRMSCGVGATPKVVTK